jgi:hypothetical protein
MDERQTGDADENAASERTWTNYRDTVFENGAYLEARADNYALAQGKIEKADLASSQTEYNEVAAYIIDDPDGQVAKEDALITADRGEEAEQQISQERQAIADEIAQIKVRLQTILTEPKTLIQESSYPEITAKYLAPMHEISTIISNLSPLLNRLSAVSAELAGHENALSEATKHNFATLSYDEIDAQADQAFYQGKPNLFHKLRYKSANVRLKHREAFRKQLQDENQNKEAAKRAAEEKLNAEKEELVAAIKQLTARVAEIVTASHQQIEADLNNLSSGTKPQYVLELNSGIRSLVTELLTLRQLYTSAHEAQSVKNNFELSQPLNPYSIDENYFTQFTENSMDKHMTKVIFHYLRTKLEAYFAQRYLSSQSTAYIQYQKSEQYKRMFGHDIVKDPAAVKDPDSMQHAISNSNITSNFLSYIPLVADFALVNSVMHEAEKEGEQSVLQLLQQASGAKLYANSDIMQCLVQSRQLWADRAFSAEDIIVSHATSKYNASNIFKEGAIHTEVAAADAKPNSRFGKLYDNSDISFSIGNAEPRYSRDAEERMSQGYLPDNILGDGAIFIMPYSQAVSNGQFYELKNSQREVGNNDFHFAAELHLVDEGSGVSIEKSICVVRQQDYQSWKEFILNLKDPRYDEKWVENHLVSYEDIDTLEDDIRKKNTKIHQTLQPQKQGHERYKIAQSGMQIMRTQAVGLLDRRLQDRFTVRFIPTFTMQPVEY